MKKQRYVYRNKTFSSKLTAENGRKTKKGDQICCIRKINLARIKTKIYVFFKVYFIFLVFLPWVRIKSVVGKFGPSPLTPFSSLDLRIYGARMNNKSLFGYKNIRFATLSIQTNALNISNNRDCSLRAHPFLSYHFNILIRNLFFSQDSV